MSENAEKQKNNLIKYK